MKKATIEKAKIALNEKLKKAITNGKVKMQGETAELFNSMQKLLNDAIFELGIKEQLLESEEEIRQNIEQIINSEQQPSIESINDSAKLNESGEGDSNIV